MVRIVGLLLVLLFLSGCSAHRCCQQASYCPTVLTIKMVEKRWGTPNEIISKRGYSWYGYVTKVQGNYPVKQNFSELSPQGSIAIPVPVARSHPKNSSSPYGCSVWLKVDKHGMVISVWREGKYCGERDWIKVVGT